MLEKNQNQKNSGEKNKDKNVALYTKYRPLKFSDVLGQDHIVSVLENSVKNQDISHAYLFIGTRGTGKTSVARIFADKIGTTRNDLYEIDAASNTGVDDIRSLTESINTQPLESKYKVYILDEVHMLSKSAFNALLKTLEEPPAHAIFILATTEPHKIPETVISRCETYLFKTPNKEILKRMIQKTAKSEGVKISKQALELISILGDGSFRDTHTILQKLLRTTSITEDHEITIEEVEQATGAPTNFLINEIIKAMLEKDLEKSLKIVKQAETENFDAKTFLSLLLQKYRALLLMKVAPNQKEIYEDLVSEDEIGDFKILLQENPTSVNSKILLSLIGAVNQSSKSITPFLPLEIILVEILEEKS